MTKPAAKALNKPLLIVGIDRRLAGLAFLLSVIVGANDGGSKIAAVVLFVALCAIGRKLTRKDANIFLVLNEARKRKALYDPAKRKWFRFSMVTRTRPW